MPKPSSIRPVVSIQYRLVTDRRTDGRTDGWSHDDTIYRASIASRGKKRALLNKVAALWCTYMSCIYRVGQKSVATNSWP